MPEPASKYAPASREVLERARALARVCEAHGTSLPPAALAFAAAPPAVTAIVVGADDAEQVRGNVALASAPPPAALWDELRERGLIKSRGPGGQGDLQAKGRYDVAELGGLAAVVTGGLDRSN